MPDHEILFKIGDVVVWKDTNEARHYYDYWFYRHFETFEEPMVVEGFQHNACEYGMNGYGNLVIEGTHYVLWDKDVEYFQRIDKYGQLELPFKGV